MLNKERVLGESETDMTLKVKGIKENIKQVNYFEFVKMDERVGIKRDDKESNIA